MIKFKLPIALTNYLALTLLYLGRLPIFSFNAIEPLIKNFFYIYINYYKI